MPLTYHGDHVQCNEESAWKIKSLLDFILKRMHHKSQSQITITMLTKYWSVSLFTTVVRSWAMSIIDIDIGVSLCLCLGGWELRAEMDIPGVSGDPGIIVTLSPTEHCMGVFVRLISWNTIDVSQSNNSDCRDAETWTWLALSLRKDSWFDTGT